MANRSLGIKIAILACLLFGCGGHPPVITEGPVRTTSAICSFPIGKIATETRDAILSVKWLKGDPDTVTFSKWNQNQREFMFAFNIKKNEKIVIEQENFIEETEEKTGPFYSYKFTGKKVDLSYKRLVGWPFPTEFKKIELEGITGEMVISKYERRMEIPLARVSLEKTYIPDFTLDRFFQSPNGKYLIFVSKAERAHPIAYVFNLEK